jgi:hypothetical protein
VQSARLRHLDVMAYLTDILRRLPAIRPTNTAAITQLLPNHWAAAHPRHVHASRNQELQAATARRRHSRARRKKAGHANLQYIRHERFFVILATKGEHRFFTEEGSRVRDIRRVPVKYAGYSISYRRGGRTRDGQPDSKWHSHVEIDRRQLLDLKAWLTEHAGKATTAELAKAIYALPVESYAPIRRQLLVLLRQVNAVRKTSGKLPLPVEVVPLRRRIVRPFSPERRQVYGR